MKIAFVINEFPCVSETFILSQIVGLLQRGHEVDIYASRPGSSTQKVHADVNRFRLFARTIYPQVAPSQKLARINSAISLVLKYGWRCPKRILDSLNVVRHGQRALNLSLLHELFSVRFAKCRYDVIHCHFGPNGQRGVELREMGMLRGSVITTFHGYDVNRLPRIHGVGMYEQLFKKGDIFTVGSEFMQQRIISIGAPKDKIVILPMGVNVTQLRFAERQRANGGEFRLLTIARLVEVKGIEFALRALALAKKQHSNIRYQIAGDGPLREKLETLTSELGIEQSVAFLGPVSQMEGQRLYESAHAFILPGIVAESGEEEGQSVVLAEAQACGLPVIASSIGGIPESMVGGVSGLLVPPKDPEALASAILRLAGNSEYCNQMGRAGREYVEKIYDSEKLHDQLVEVYHLGRNVNSRL